MSPFQYRIVTEWSQEDECFIARVPAFPGLAAHGDSAARAAEEAVAAAQLMLEEMAESDQRPPEPDASVDYSGNIRLRLPKALHRQLDQEAAAEGISLNALMVAKLSGASPARGRSRR